MEGRGIVLGFLVVSRDFFVRQNVQISFRVNQALLSVDARVKLLVLEVDHSPPTGAEVMQRSCIFSLYILSSHRKLYLFIFTA
jgi:hypothetical protein